MSRMKTVFRVDSLARCMFAVLFVVSFKLTESGLAAHGSQKDANRPERVLDGMSKETTGSGIVATRPSFEDEVRVVSEVITYDPITSGLSEEMKNRNEEADTLTELARKTRQKSKKSRKPYPEIQDDLSRTNARVKENRKTAEWLGRLKKFLDFLDVISVGGSAAGHLYEGDLHGAAGTLLDEAVKKGITGLGAVIGTPVLGGTIVGSALGEELHERLFQRRLEGSVDSARVESARQRMLKDPFQRTKIYGPDGNVYTLPPDLYLDPKTMNIRRYTPEQMKAIREGRRDEREKLKDDTHPLNAARIKMERGEMSRTEFDQLVKDYNERGLAGISKPSDADANKQPAKTSAWTPVQGQTIVPPRVIDVKKDDIVPPPVPSN